MAAPIIAGLLFGGGVYYVSRVAPRIAARAAAASQARARQHLSQHVQARQQLLPYHAFERPFLRTMTEREALLLLGFPENAIPPWAARPPQEEVKKRYRALMKDFHSDVGGSPLITSKLNEAMDLLSR